MTGTKLFRMIGTKLVVAQLLASTPLTLAVAQTTAVPDSSNGAGATVSVRVGAGYTHFNFDDLNSRLAVAGLPKLGSHHATFGIGADVRAKRLILGAGWQSLVTRTANADPYRTMVNGGVGLLDAGVVLVKRGPFIAYPSVGLGGRVVSINVQERGDFSFDDGLSQPRRAVDLAGIAFVYDLGAGAEWRVSRTVPLAITARAGIVRNIGAEHWYSESGKVHGGPRAARGSYVQLGVATAVPVRSVGRSVAGAAARD